MTNHQGSINARIGKIAKYKEGLKALREAIIKADAMGKSIKSSQIIAQYKMGTGVIQALIRLKAIEDKNPGGVYASGEFKWIYSNNPTGEVDNALIEKTIDKENEIKKSDDRQTRQPRTVVPETLKKIPTGNKDGMNEVVKWLEDELTKEDVIPGYLRASQKLMYIKIKNMVGGLSELKTAIDNLGI